MSTIFGNLLGILIIAKASNIGANDADRNIIANNMSWMGLQTNDFLN